MRNGRHSSFFLHITIVQLKCMPKVLIRKINRHFNKKPGEGKAPPPTRGVTLSTHALAWHYRRSTPMPAAGLCPPRLVVNDKFIFIF
jgi:hypothetical protein